PRARRRGRHDRLSGARAVGRRRRAPALLSGPARALARLRPRRHGPRDRGRRPLPGRGPAGRGARRAARVLLGAVPAAPVDREVREAGFVAERLADGVAGAVELVRGDREHVAAALADEELALALTHQAVAAGAVADVDVADDAELLEQL